MSEYEEQLDDMNVICPYCEYSYQCEPEDYDEDGHVEECEECGKKFHMSTSFSVTHHSQPDCILNGDEHLWEPVTLRSGKAHDFCSVCGECRRLML